LENSHIDGVYDITTMAFETDTARRAFPNLVRPEDRKIRYVEPESLFREHMAGRTGLWETNGIVVRRECFERVGLFDENLRISQDSHMWLRMAALLTLVRSPILRPVAVYRRHEGNRWRPGQADTPEGYARQTYYWDSLYEWFAKTSVDEGNRQSFLWGYMIQLGKQGRWRRAWQVAWAHRKPWWLLRSLRGRIPGPRTIHKHLQGVRG
jgi:hypothetical protein